jgi:hypothetical protein
VWIAKAVPKTQRAEAPGRPAGRVAGGWISDVAALKQCVLLCEFCQNKFDPKRYGYRKWKNTYVSVKCDGCKAHTIRGTAFIHEGHYSEVINDNRPKRGRWAL